MTTVIVCATLSFLSTSSARRTTGSGTGKSTIAKISIHVLREEDDASAAASPPGLSISIHVLREEDDA